MAPTSINQLGVVAQVVLDTAVTILNTTDLGAPESQFLTPSRPSFDCEFVAVQTTYLTDDTTSPMGLDSKKRNKFGNLPMLTFLVYVVRCAPEIVGAKLPSDAAKTQSALDVMQDGWALWNGFRAVQDDIFDGCLGIYFDFGLPIQEQGGYVGWQFEIRASIEGYEP
jgi:hypothetical protein